jgi:hypothetical protein
MLQVWFASMEDLIHEQGSILRGQAIEQRKQRQRDFAALQIRAQRLADSFFLTEKIGQIIVNLISDAKMPTEPAGRIHKSSRETTQFAS